MDGFSRVLGTFAVLISLAGGYYFHSENTKLKQELTAVKEKPPAESSPPAEMDYEAAKVFNEHWDAQLKAALADFNGRVEKALDEEETARGNRDAAIELALEQLKKDHLDLATMKQRLDQFDNLALAPNLSLAETRMRPVSAGEPGYIVVANTGGADAEITSALFKPRADGQFKLSAESVPREDAADQFVIEFSPLDNTAKTEGRHSDYQRSYLDAARKIGRGDSVKLYVEIQNAQHQGWGWEGDLELSYADGKKLTVPGIRAVFVGQREST